MIVLSVNNQEFRGSVIDCIKLIGDYGERWAEGLADASDLAGSVGYDEV